MIDNNHILYILLWISIIVISGILIMAWFPSIREGFTPVGDSAFWARFVPRRGDVGIDAEQEEAGYRRDPRYFAGYTDVQRLGVAHDFCRTVVPVVGEDTDSFVACALAGTEGLATVSYRSPSVRQGLERSRDDYMRDVNGDGRAEYCSIIPRSGQAPEIVCYKAGETAFSKSTITDSSPPADIATLVQFYEGAMVWLRMRDDLVDYARAASVSLAGAIRTSEYIPRDQPTQGIQFNGVDQFLRLGEASKTGSGSLQFGAQIPLRFMRAVSCWVYFDEFTNNARIFDFGNGAGMDNVFLGIIGRGSAGVQQELPTSICDSAATATVPVEPTGAQDAATVSPQEAAAKKPFSCPTAQVIGRKGTATCAVPKAVAAVAPATTADLIYEIWDSQDRKMRLTVPAAVTLKKWTHITVTALNNDALRPDIGIYVDGRQVLKHAAGHLPQTSKTTHNYIGKSNWTSAFSQYNNKDELFKGSLFDFRMYATPMSEEKIAATVEWGRKQLNIDQ